MSTMTRRPEILIVIPIHEETGWKSSSPTEVKARLEACSPKCKSPEELHLAEERAHELHQIHLEAVRR